MEVLFNPFSLAKKFKRPLILDGAMGTLLHSRGLDPVQNLWMSYANITNSRAVRNIHEEYINSGADIITTNTFRTNPYAINRSGIKDPDIIEKSVNLALDAAEGLSVFVAGSNAPAEDCYQVNRTISRELLEENHYAHITNLFKKGCDFVLNETQSHWDEIELISIICKDENIPFIISLYFNDDLRINSGENVKDAIELISEFAPLAIGFNCIKKNALLKLLQTTEIDVNWGFYLNCGTGLVTDEKLSCSISPEEYQHIVKDLLAFSPSFVGGCCGTSPAHIKKIKELFDETTITI